MWIYLATNRINGKVYVGQTRTTAKRRWSNHLRNARFGKQSPFYAAIRKYGPQSFDVVEICWCESQEALNHCERLLIGIFQSQIRRFGYNVCAGGRTTHMTPEGRKRLSDLMRRKNPMRNPDVVARNHANDHLRHNPRWVGALNPVHRFPKRGISVSAEQRKKQSEAMKGKPPWNKGIPCREETKLRISKTKRSRRLNVRSLSADY